MGDALCAEKADKKEARVEVGHVGLETDTNAQEGESAEEYSSSSENIMEDADETLDEDLVELDVEVEVADNSSSTERIYSVVARTHEDGSAGGCKKAQRLSDLEVIHKKTHKGRSGDVRLETHPQEGYCWFRKQLLLRDRVHSDGFVFALVHSFHSNNYYNSLSPRGGFALRTREVSFLSLLE